MTDLTTDEPIRIGVSKCLLGENVRFDGGHSRDRFVTDEISRWVEYVPVCPEVEMGMGTPRPTIRLVDNGDGVRLFCPSTGEDFTDAMQAFSARKLRELKEANLDGFILKRRSPSCGMSRLPVYRGKMKLPARGVGLFAEALMSTFPTLPVEEDGRLNDPMLRENFIERIFCHHRWRKLSERGLTRGRLVAFHTQHKLLLLSHHRAGYDRLGKLVASLTRDNEEEVFKAYPLELYRCLQHRATKKTHVNVLQHALGHLRRHFLGAETQSLLQSIEDFRHGLVPLIVPVTLLRFNIERYDITYLKQQFYFMPHPKELMLRNYC